MFQKLKDNNLLLLILLLGAILRMYHLDFQSIWLDEIHTMNEANPSIPLSDLYDTIMTGEQMPPLYFYMLYFVFKIFGYTTLVARSYSAALGILSLYASYLLGKELFNKQVGLLTAFVLTLNYFHLSYSQEARPYMLLLLFSVISFYKLVQFLKKPDLNNALWHGFFAGLMISSHFFGLFALLSQYVILLIFILLTDKQNKRPIFINSFFSGLFTLFLFIPSIKIFIKVSNIKEFWIPAPTSDAYTLIYNEFFGNSEMVLGIVSVFLLSYLIKLTKQNDFLINQNSVIKSQTVFSFIILFFWIFITLLIPLIRSYVSAPMIISRYFIIILPAISIIVAIGIAQFKNKIIQFTLVLLFFVFSVSDIIVVKKYYFGVIKSQFREVSEYIHNYNDSNDPLFTSLAWYFPYFLNNDSIKTKIVDKNLEAHVMDMIQNPASIKAFWYADAHGRPLNLSENAQKFINDHFYISESFDGFDAWAKHYILTKDAKKPINISQFLPLKTYNGDSFAYNIESMETINNKIIVKGWAYFNEQDAKESVVNILLVKNNEAESVLTEKINRPDVTSYFKSQYDLSNSGFSSIIDLATLKPGSYSVAIFLENKSTKKIGLNISDKKVDKKD